MNLQNLALQKLRKRLKRLIKKEKILQIKKYFEAQNT